VVSDEQSLKTLQLGFMGYLRLALARILLFKTFIKTLARQLYLKLTKLTRRSRGPRAFGKKLTAGYDFLREMCYYNRDVIRRSRRCLKQLTADNVHQVFVYGEKDVREVLYHLAFEFPVELRTIHEGYESSVNSQPKTVPLEMTRVGREKVIVASLVNIEERIRRLRELGVNDERIVRLH
jgi:hypothetical protein